MLSLPSTARLPATYAAVAITFAHLKTPVHAGFGEPNREPAATDSERRQAMISDAGNHLGFPPVSQRYPHDDVQLPQLRWCIPLPPSVLSLVHLV